MRSLADAHGVDPFAQRGTFWGASCRLSRYRVSLGGPMRVFAGGFKQMLQHNTRNKQNKLVMS